MVQANGRFSEGDAQPGRVCSDLPTMPFSVNTLPQLSETVTGLGAVQILKNLAVILTSQTFRRLKAIGEAAATSSAFYPSSPPG